MGEVVALVEQMVECMVAALAVAMGEGVGVVGLVAPMVGTVSVVSWPPGMVCTVSFKKSFVVLSSTSNEVCRTPASSP